VFVTLSPTAYSTSLRRCSSEEGGPPSGEGTRQPRAAGLVSRPSPDSIGRGVDLDSGFGGLCLDFFLARLRNRHTRRAYTRQARAFCARLVHQPLQT
jgi:hypothetical protein